MKTCTYNEVQQLAGDLLSRAGSAERIPANEAVMLKLFFAAQLPDLWQREAWPELCDHLEAVTLDANNCFSLREGDSDEMGEILAIIAGGDPRVTTAVTPLPRHQYARLDDRVNVVSATSAVWVDWQTPCPDLLAVAADDLDDYELPARFKLPLAALGAAHLCAETDPQLGGLLRGVAESDLLKQASRIVRPWWRR